MSHSPVQRGRRREPVRPSTLFGRLAGADGTGWAESSAGRRPPILRIGFAILGAAFLRRLLRFRPPIAPLTIGLLATGAVALGLATTNPGQARFEEFAGDQISELIIKEICIQGGLSALVRLVVPNCPLLVRAQRPVFGQLAWEQTRRRNFGLFSLYRTEMGGQQLLPNLRLPVYRATTLGIAGQLVVLTSGDQPAGPGQP